jgi:hypothetical protein
VQVVYLVLILLAAAAVQELLKTHRQTEPQAQMETPSFVGTVAVVVVLLRKLTPTALMGEAVALLEVAAAAGAVELERVRAGMAVQAVEVKRGFTHGKNCAPSKFC